MARTNKQISEELDKNLDEMEFLKADSDFLRGTIEQGLADQLRARFHKMTLSY